MFKYLGQLNSRPPKLTNMPLSYRARGVVRRYVRRVRRGVAFKKTFRNRGPLGNYRRPLNMLQIRQPGFAATRFMHHRFTTGVSAALVGGSLNNYSFKANNIYRPFGAGSAFDAVGFDQQSVFYRQWMVVGSKIDVRYAGIGTAGSITPIVWGVYVDTDTVAASTTYAGMIEQKKGKYMMVNNQTTNPRGITKGFSTKRFFNCVNPRDNWGQLGATLGAPDPVQLAYYQLWVQPQSGTTADTVLFVVTIDYTVAWGDSLDLARSVL